ncbi:hypothetical protein [Cohnella soli]|uniref:Uncharacterized protein n=1 Tax=Cohnella soli TaxID=425005 RepID=A0ABW0HY49_9BACL
MVAIAEISIDDLDVPYKNLILNDRISLAELTSELKLSFVENKENVRTRVAGNVKDTEYDWFQISYPNKEHADLIFDYLFNATNKSGRIVSVELINVATKRGVVVGDSIEKVKQVYGKDLVEETAAETTNSLSVIVNKNKMSFIYDKNTVKITEIYIDYDSNQAMEEMDIPSLED